MTETSYGAETHCVETSIFNRAKSELTGLKYVNWLEIKVEDDRSLCLMSKPIVFDLETFNVLYASFWFEQISYVP